MLRKVYHLKMARILVEKFMEDVLKTDVYCMVVDFNVVRTKL